jgi:hypothetical protein
VTLPIISDDERRGRLAFRHLLLPEKPAADLPAVAEALVALHSSDPVTVYLAAAARLEHPSVETVDNAMYRDRSLFRHHAMRRTLWVMGPETVRAAHAACTVKIAATETKRFLAWLEATPSIARPDQWLEMATEQIVTYLEAGTAASTREIGLAMPELTVPVTVGKGSRQETTITAHSRVLLIAALNGKVVRTAPQGSWTASNYIWDTAARWGLPELTSSEPDRGAALLLARVLDRFGPCTLRDLTWWTGWTQTMTRKALQAISATEVMLESGSTAWVNPGDTATEDAPPPWVALLPGLDPTTMGWKEREWYLDPDVAEHVFDRNGNAGPTIWIDGKVVGGWAQRPDGEIIFDLHRQLSRKQRTMLEEAASRLVGFVGETRFRVRFPSPNQKRLLA